MKDIVILGTGGCARELQWLLEQNNTQLPEAEQWRILAFVDTKADENQIVNGLPVYTDEWLTRQNYMQVACGLGEARVRKRVIEKLRMKNRTLQFPKLVSKDARVSDRVKMGEGCIICAGAIVTCNISLGDFVIVNLGSIITHDTEIGAYTQVNPSTNISGGVIVGCEVQIGTGVKVIPHVTIGDRAIIGAGAVVVRDIPSGCTAVGCPAKVIKTNS